MTRLPVAGQRIRLVAMLDDPDPLPKGLLGTVEQVVPTGVGQWQVWMKWDNGRMLALACPPDLWEDA